jgi:hypothetical protein
MKVSRGFRVGRVQAAGGTKLSFKDYFSLCLSVAAFLVSGLSAYVNVVRQSDEIRVVVDQLPRVEVDWLGEKEGLGVLIDTSKELRLLFINSGNRSAALRKIAVGYVVLKEGESPSADCKGASYLPTSGDLPTLKEKSTTIVTAKLLPSPIFDSGIVQRGDILSIALPYKEIRVQVCAQVALATPSIGYASKDFKILQTSNLTSFRWDLSADKTAPPVLIHSRSGNIFVD